VILIRYIEGMARQITIGELMTIDSGRIEKASGCVVSLERTYHELKKATILDRFKAFFRSTGLVNAYYVIFKLSVVSASGHKYTVIVKVNPDFDLVHWQSNPCKIYCNCPDFKFRCAYTLGQRGGLFVNERIRIELGQAMTDKPKRQPSYLCKHSYAALEWLIDNYSNIMKTI